MLLFFFQDVDREDVYHDLLSTPQELKESEPIMPTKQTLECSPNHRGRLGVVSIRAFTKKDDHKLHQTRITNWTRKSGVRPGIKSPRRTRSNALVPDEPAVTETIDAINSEKCDASDVEIKVERMDDCETDGEVVIRDRKVESSKTSNVFICPTCLRKFTRKVLMLECAHDADAARTPSRLDVLNTEAHLLFDSFQNLNDSVIEKCNRWKNSEDDTETGRESCQVENASPDDSLDGASDETVTTTMACDECGEVFLTDTLLKKHSIRVHSAKRYAIRAPPNVQCKKKTSLSAAGKDALRTVAASPHEMKLRPFVCTNCDRSFVLPANLARHVAVHRRNGETVTEVGRVRAYSCAQCGKVFRCLSHLKGHEHIHDGIKSFVCEVCGKGFIANSSLTKHMKKHTGEK